MLFIKPNAMPDADEKPAPILRLKISIIKILKIDFYESPKGRFTPVNPIITRPINIDKLMTSSLDSIFLS